MSITVLFGCCQIELSVRDLDATRSFMQVVLGSGKIEQGLAKEIGELFPDGGYRVDHLDCGEAIFQLNEPSDSITYRGQKSIHQAYQDSVGNCVTNLNFFVDDAVHAHELLTAMGAPTHIQGPSCAARSLADYGPDNTRPGGEARSFYFIGARQLIGLDLELMEPNFLCFTRQAVQYPCFVQPRPVVEDGSLKLLRIRLAVDDLDTTYENISRIFAPASRSKAYAVRKNSLAKAFRIGLGGIELEYCQPLSRDGLLASQLQQYGPGVVAIEFGARDPQRILRTLEESHAATVVEEIDLFGCAGTAANDRISHRISCRDITGFDVILRPLEQTELA